jgi:hypothetical protein
LCSDEAAAVRASACKTVGVFISTWNSDFISKSITILLRVLNSDSNLNARVWASWSIANLCDSITKDPSIQKNISQSQLEEIVKASIKSIRDNDKVSIFILF